jgi:hypothetical protein
VIRESAEAIARELRHDMVTKTKNGTDLGLVRLLGDWRGLKRIKSPPIQF